MRYVDNKVLELQRERLLSKQPFLTYGETSKLLTQMKKEDDMLWLQLPLVQALQRELMDLNRSIQEFRAEKKTSHLIAQEFGWVVMKELKAKNMTKSAKGTMEQLGKNVRAKSSLNRSILRFSPYILRCCIEWNLRKTGGQLGACRLGLYHSAMSMLRPHGSGKSAQSGRLSMPEVWS